MRALTYEDGTSKLLDQFLVNVRHAGLEKDIVVWPATTINALRFLSHIHHTDRLQRVDTFEDGRLDGRKTLHDKLDKNLPRPDVIYLDSAHQKDETVLEMEHAWAVLRPGGVK